MTGWSYYDKLIAYHSRANARAERIRTVPGGQKIAEAVLVRMSPLPLEKVAAELMTMI